MLTPKSPDPFPIAQAAERALDRRRFLCIAGAAAVAAAGGEWLGHKIAAARLRTLAVRMPAGASLAVGEDRALTDPEGGEALVVRLDESTIVAFDRRCPHLGCPVLWSRERGRFECPCHSAAFDARTGRALEGPTRQGLEPAVVEGA